MNTALEYSTRVVREGGRRCKKSTLNDLVHLTPLRIPLMNPPYLGGPTEPERSTVRQRGKEGPGLAQSAEEHTVFVLEREDLGTPLLLCSDKMFRQEN